MMLTPKTISRGFLIAGLMNLSVLIFSRFFTNSTIPEFDPDVLSNFGILMIVIWGLAYMSVANNYQSVPWLVAVFAVEKFIYGFVWTKWMLYNSVLDVFEKDVMAGIFYSIYGINDWFFCVFFTYVLIIKNKHAS